MLEGNLEGGNNQLKGNKLGSKKSRTNTQRKRGKESRFKKLQFPNKKRVRTDSAERKKQDLP